MTGLRRCGKRWASKEEAERSKKARNGNFMAIDCRCGGVHLQPLVLKPLPPRKPSKDTGPDAAMRALVVQRDGYRCVCCGHTTIGQPCDIQHRTSRGMGGTSDPAANSPVNLLLMLRDCHARVESRIDPEDNAKGYWLRMGEDPALTPVMYFGQDGGFTAWLLADGSLDFDGSQIGAA